MATAKLKHLRISPRKVRLVADLIRGLSVQKAEQQLKFLPKKAAEPILKLLRSATANAKDVDKIERENLYISKIVVEAGPTLKRWMPRAMGRATPIMKRTSHISLTLEQLEGTPVKQKPVEKAVKPKEEKPEQKLEPLEKVEEIVPAKPKKVSPPRPYPTTSKSKKKFFSRQTFGNAKKLFRRKSI